MDSFPLFFRLFLLTMAAGFTAAPEASAVLRHPGMTDQQALDLGELPQFASRAAVFSSANACSGAFLNSEWVVLADHCFPHGAAVTVQYRFAGQQYSRTGTAYSTPSGDPGYDDVALVHLDSPITQAVRWVAPYPHFDEFERLGWQVGRGLSGELGDSSTHKHDGQFRAITQRAISTRREANDGAGSSIIPQHIYYNFLSPVVANPHPLSTRYEGGTGPGDSGGPFYMFKRGRFYNASVVSGPQDGSYRNGRLSTHLDAIVARSGIEFAYPQPLRAAARWVAEDLPASQAASTPVSAWPDRYAELTWSEVVDGGSTARPLLLQGATPTGMAALHFNGGEALQLAEAHNPFVGETSMSVVMVIRATAAGEGTQSDPFATTGVLDGSTAGSGRGWGLSLASSGRYGWVLNDHNSVKSVFRGGAGNNSVANGDWRVVVATWDGSDILHDNAGDDRNMKLFVDSIEQSAELQGPHHFNIGRATVDLLLGKSNTKEAAGFSGEIAEVRFYRGTLPLHEVDRLLTGLRGQYIAGGTPGVVFERPWSAHVALPIGQSLRTRGFLTGGGRSMQWDVASGPAPVVFSDALSPDTDIEFAEPGVYQLEALVSDGQTTAVTPLTVKIYLPGSGPTSTASIPVAGNWIDSNLGTTVTGGADASGSTVTLTAGGRGVGIGEGETYDEGRFHWKGVAGDFDWVARLDSVGNASGPTRAGLMVRGGRGPTDAAAFLGMAPDGKLYTLVRRAGGFWGDLTLVDNPDITLPAHLKIERRGNDFRFLLSQDGVSFAQTGTVQSISLPGVARVGLFATSGNASDTINAVFSNMSLSQIGPALASISTLSDFSSDASPAYHPAFTGSEDPWLKVSTTSGPEGLSFAPTYVNEKEVWRATGGSGGNYVSRFTVDDGSALTYLERFNALNFLLRYDFNTEGNTEGWTAVNVGNLTVADGVISGTPTSGDPQLIRTGLSLNGDQFTRVTVRLRASIDSPIRLFWGTSNNDNFAAARRATVDYSGGGEFQTLVFEMEGVDQWAGQTITRLRVDPAEGPAAEGGYFEVDSIVISDSQPPSEASPIVRFDFSQNGDFEGWQRTKDIENDYVAGGRLVGRATGADPILTNNDVSFPADTIESALVRIRVSHGGLLELFWATTQANGFAGTRRVSVEVVGGDVWQTVRLPLAGNPEWDGQTITRLRLDPINQSDTDFAIETIVLSDGDADGDGIPDVFELEYGLDPLDPSDATLDSSGNGLTNLQSYIAGIDPLDPLGAFRVSNVVVSDNEFKISVEGKAGRIYKLYRSETLAPGSWLSIDTIGPLAIDQPVEFEDPDRFDRAFYRVEVSLP